MKLTFRVKEFLQSKETLLKFYKKNGLLVNSSDDQKHFVYIPCTGAKVLFVAHLDTVLPARFKGANRKNLYATGLDDRLGVAICHHLVFDKGLCADILLCDHEEIGRSTAQYFPLSDKYNWVVEFDRAGTDFVDYDLGNTDLNDKILDLGMSQGWGAFSDICSLENPHKIACFNWGIGYYNAHGENSYVSKSQCNRQVSRFVKLFNAEHENKYACNIEVNKWWHRKSYDRYDYDYKGEYGGSSSYKVNKQMYTTFCDRCDEWRACSWSTSQASMLCDDCADVYLPRERALWCDLCGNNVGKSIYSYTICEQCLDRMVADDLGVTS